MESEAWAFIKQVVQGRWFSVYAGMMMMIGNGTTYIFGTYSKVLKTEFDYSQTQVNMLGFAKDLGSNVGIIAGLLAEFVPTWVLFTIGAFQNFTCYFFIWLSMTRRIPQPEFWQMFLSVCFGSNSSNYANTAIMVISLRNFPDRRGIILGLLKGEEFLLYKLKKQNLNRDPSVALSIVDQKVTNCPKSFSTLEEIAEISPSCISNICNKPDRGNDFTVLQAIFSIDMLLICLATFSGCGSSLAAIDNLGQIGESLGYPARAISIFVSWVSIFNFFGRVFSGFISELMIIKYKLPRPLMFAFAFLLTCLGQLCIAYPFPGSVYVASSIIGFGFGAQNPLLFAVISEMFGLKHYSILFNCGQLVVPLGSYILNVDIVGKLYDAEALREGRKMTGKGITCTGAHCFGGSFTILAASTLFGALVMLLLAYRTRDYYRWDIYKNYKEDMWIPQAEMEFYRLDNRKNIDD
ncbi:protein NUCLEAR FUSION DEFECTIVE 4-like [Cucumis melo var. makuwa]|uniref:Protein NUCLEAR FUSION DEFECTIVE 4-like n=2 Tax=Cucumis melo TaxID=3656 RepID=A0A5A7U9N3_CUCMM|nr:protein NUCLEAR FUSION DEFECTIVE 4-like [Cucumis melo var. makuwa]TYK17152.1 protein NUCLEAR FUSION DEFECTIVE 4-like [Cucumis melo var. makuwa]